MKKADVALMAGLLEDEHERRFSTKSLKGHDCAKNAEAGYKLCKAIQAAKEATDRRAGRQRESQSPGH